MDNMLKASINRLVKTSLYLFLFTNIAIFATLITHNILIQSKFIYSFYQISSEDIKNYDCNESNNFCYDFWETKSTTLDQCPINEIRTKYNISDVYLGYEVDEFKYILFDKNKKIKPEYKESNIFISFEVRNKKNAACIKNYPISYSLYKVFPQLANLIVNTKLKPNYYRATAGVVNPFFYGETSISNIAKRYPLYLIFKPLLIISSLLMIFYWTYTKKVILLFDRSEKIQSYYVLGVLSGIFLFLHVIFLGSEIDNEIFRKLRKFIIVFFILFELMAQFFLIKKLFSIKKLINNYTNYFFLQLKWFFVLIFLILTVIITCLLIFTDLPKEVDYIIEWNYFVILSFYYLFTFYLWKKINF